MFKIIVGLALVLYGLFILVRPNSYYRWLKKQHQRTKVTAEVKHLWQVKVRGSIYLGIGAIFLIWGLVEVL